MIDLHAHTDESDGTAPPRQLVEQAVGLGLEALAITDHDTFKGYDEAAPWARDLGLELVCGIELTTRLPGRTKLIHLLGYWVDRSPTPEFREWLNGILEARRERNRRQAARLGAMGVDVTLDEAEAYGRSITGRPHFARVMMAKGYVASLDEAFSRYLGEGASAYEPKQSPTVEEGIARMRAAGGLPTLAHPVRLGLRDAAEEERMIADLQAAGLAAIEAYHSDHGPADVARYLGYANRHGLKVTGGSDYHGDNKPGIRLGVGRGETLVPRAVLDALR